METRAFLAAVLALGVGSCQRVAPASREGTLIEKGAHQATYGPDGKIIRLLHDANGDQIADVVTLFFPNGSTRQVETDTDGNGFIDRWQYFSPSGTLEKEATARRKPGTPDLWLFPVPQDGLTRRELDENGDGAADRIEHFDGEQLARVELDADSNGRIDRWQSFSGSGVVQEELDTDGDGVADLRLRAAIGGGLRSERIGGSGAAVRAQ